MEDLTDRENETPEAELNDFPENDMEDDINFNNDQVIV